MNNSVELGGLNFKFIEISIRIEKIHFNIVT